MLKSENIHKITWTVVMVVLLGAAVFSGPRHMVFENRIFKGVDNIAVGYVDAALQRAGAAYALARTFNAVVSVFEESRIQLEPGGVGVSLALGEVLDPANDLVERFSWVMLASLTSLGIQKVLIEISPWISIQILFSAALILLIVGLWVKGRFSDYCQKAGKTLVFAVILVRFAVPAMAFINNQVYVSVLEKRHDEAIGKFETDIAQIKASAPEGLAGMDRSDAERGDSLWYRVKEAMNLTLEQGKNLVDVQTRLQQIKAIAKLMIDRIVDLIVVFVLNTIVLPLFFLWGIVRLGKMLAGVTPSGSRGSARIV